MGIRSLSFRCAASSNTAAGFGARRWLVPALALLCAGPAAAIEPVPLFSTGELEVAGHRVHVEVATRRAAHRQGLQHRQSLPADTGMLFVFDTPNERCFWMLHTPLPLSVAFIDGDGRIVHIAAMAPNSRERHCSPPGVGISQALEMPQGWFATRGIAPGASVTRLQVGEAEGY
ncbi:MAG: DUF192 domain-containing protein [Pseudomonadota bacterium]|nr:DUF192 domain-containing protein [Pseudomonadota bacterium]